jgi:ribosome-associated heat shock protein Hsp15
MPAADDGGTLRLDVWLDVACLFKTRSEAQRACTAGKVHVNGTAAKPHRLLHLGDEIHITRPRVKQVVVVRTFAEHHLPKAEARLLYEDRTPPPSPEELEERRLRRQFSAPLPRPATTPDKRARRQLRRLKGTD